MGCPLVSLGCSHTSSVSSSASTLSQRLYAQTAFFLGFVFRRQSHPRPPRFDSGLVFLSPSSCSSVSGWAFFPFCASLSRWIFCYWALNFLGNIFILFSSRLWDLRCQCNL